MYRVLLVDDEIWSLEGINKLLDWEENGFSVMAQVTDPSEAWDIICSDKPDVVFTDIRMPEISGLELLNMSRKSGSTAEFIVVSGYAEFEYAQEALRYGAFDYQLKPIDPDEAEQLLGRLKEHLDRKQQTNNAQIYERLSMGEDNPLEVLRTKGFVPRGEFWQTVTIYGASKEAAGKVVSMLHPWNSVTLPITDNKMLILLNGDLLLDHEGYAELDRWAFQYGLRIGISSVSDDAGLVSKLMRESDMAALAAYFIHRKSGLIPYNPVGSAEIERAVAKLEKWMRSKDYDEISGMLDQMVHLFQVQGLGLYHVTQLWNRIVLAAGRRLENSLPEDSIIDFMDYEEVVHRFKSFPDMIEVIRELFKKVCSSTEQGTSKHPQYNEHFVALLEFVNKNFCMELSLSELSERYYLNMSYCSELFKKVTGFTFTDYVTQLRMQLAVELLQDGSYTADQVCHMSGYRDYYYFSKMFKKFHGVPPSYFTGKRRYP